MRKLFQASALILFASIVEPALAGPEEDALAAIQAHDFPKALAIWTPLAKSGDMLAQQGLGGMYLAGMGVPRDPRLAIYWLSQAAEKGDAASQFNLGQLYSHESGYIDLAKAAGYYHQAAKRGKSEAQSMLAGYYLSGTGVPKDIVKAYVWISLASNFKPPPNMNAASAKRLASTLKARVDAVRRQMTSRQQSDAEDLLLRCTSLGLNNCD